MPGLKFRVLLDSDKNEEVFRDILISDASDFETFYHAIMKSFNFKGDQMASFYVSNEDWDKGHEISFLDMSYDDDSIDSPASVMKNAVIKDFLEEPDQRFILVYDFMKMWIFLVELIGYDRNEPSAPEMLLAIGNLHKIQLAKLFWTITKQKNHSTSSCHLTCAMTISFLLKSFSARTKTCLNWSN